MKWIANKNELKWEIRWAAMKEWHRWYAWRPIYIPKGKHDSLTPAHWVWLEYVDRIYVDRNNHAESPPFAGWMKQFRPYTDTEPLPCTRIPQLS